MSISAKYYVITNALFSDNEFAYGEQLNCNYKTGRAKYCKDCNSPISVLEWLPPFEINISKKRLGDLIFGSYVGFFVSKKFKNEFEETDLKGISSFKKATLFFQRELLNEEYYYTEIEIINASVDLNRLVLEDGILCDTCQKGDSILSKINGVSFTNPDKINNDIFFSSTLGQANIIISERFKNFVEEFEFTNLKIVSALQFSWDSLNPISQ